MKKDTEKKLQLRRKASEFLKNSYRYEDPSIYDILLQCRTSKQNIIFANDDWAKENPEYTFDTPIPRIAVHDPDKTIFEQSMIRPSFCKAFSDKRKRAQDKAEVFTAPWIVNLQINLIDAEYWGGESPFNKQKTPEHNGWVTSHEPIPFPNKHDETWQHYVRQNRLEITCGEAPYIVSRYDTTTGEMVPVKERVGMLDRKLRVVNENTTTQQDWEIYALLAVQGCYGYEYQGDNLYLGRKNVLDSIIDYHVDRFDHMPSTRYLKIIAETIAWNFFQMDGLKHTLPNKENVNAIIFDWKGMKILEFKSLIQEQPSSKRK